MCAGGAGLALLGAVLAGFGVPMAARVGIVAVTTVIAWGLAYRRGWFDGPRARRADGGEGR